MAVQFCPTTVGATSSTCGPVTVQVPHCQLGLVNAGHGTGGIHGVVTVTESPSTFLTTAIRLG